MDGIEKVKAGIVPIEEVLRTTQTIESRAVQTAPDKQHQDIANKGETG